MKPLTEEERQQLRPLILNLRIIVFALCMGVSTFAGFSIYQKIPPPPPAGPQQIWPPVRKPQKEFTPLHITAILFAGVAAALSFVVPPFLGSVKPNAEQLQGRDGAIGQAAAIVQTRTIVACALLEGAAFFNVFCYFSTDSIYNLAMAGILLLLIVLHFPLSGAYFSKIERIMGVDPFAAQYS